MTRKTNSKFFQKSAYHADIRKVFSGLNFMTFGVHLSFAIWIVRFCIKGNKSKREMTYV